jgi:hypothetical protein
MISTSDIKVNFSDKKVFGSDSKFGGLKPLTLTTGPRFGSDVV